MIMTGKISEANFLSLTRIIIKFASKMSHKICAGLDTLCELKRFSCIPVKLNIFTMLESADRFKENGKEERKNILCQIYSTSCMFVCQAK